MTPEEWEKVSEIYHDASELDGDARSQFLDKQCAGDASLRREVESLLAADLEAGDFISEPVAGAFASDVLKREVLSAGDMIGHYRVLSKVGTGGMGEVFLAADTKLGRNVAIKTLSPVFDGDESFLERFRNEARAAASLNHPHVATVYSVEEHHGRPFIAMEFIDGKTLENLIPDGGVDIRTMSEWFVPVARALGHAHSRGVVHRDIKPGNIMITNDGIVKILDFGLAFFRPSAELSDHSRLELTQAGQLLGTPSYMSPEQAEGKEVDHRSDIFSLGVVMYEAVTGRRPFRGDSHAEVVSNLLKSEPPEIEKARPDISPALATLIKRCLEKRRRDRPQNMDEIRDVLDRLVTGKINAPSTGSFSQRFYRQAASGSIWPKVAAVVSVLAVAFAGWMYFSRENEPPMNFSNMAIRRLSQTSDVVFASITPDGKSLIYNTINEDGDRTLWIRRVDDRNALKLLGPEPVQFWGGLVANDDTSQIYFVTANRAGSQSALYRISALGGTPRKLADGVNDLGSLTADGKRILFVRYREQLRIVSADADDGSNERIIREEDSSNSVFRDPQYSADGKLIYYSRMDRVDGIEWWQLVSIPADGGDETVIIPRRREKINEIAVLKDGSGLLINGTDPTSFLSQLFFVSLPDGKLTRLTNDINSYFGISVDKAGRSIVAAERSDDKRVFVGDVGALDRAQSITPEPNVFRLAEWAPDGRILYDATDNSRSHIWIADSDGGNKQQLTPNESADMHPHVSGDGKYVVFTSTRSGIDQVWRMNIDGSNPVLLANVEGATGAPRFGPDGHTVYFYWARGNETKMGRVDVTGGEVTELPRFSESEWAMSPDGSRMAYVIRDASNRTRLAIMRMDSPTPERVLDSSPIYLLEWSPDGKSVLLREREEGTNPYSTIIEQNLVTGKRSIYLSTAPDYVIDLSFSRDGKRAAMVRGRLSTDAVMLTTSGGRP